MRAPRFRLFQSRPYWAFLLCDGIGAVLWASLGVTTGVVFAREIPAMAGRIEDSGKLLLLLFLAAGAIVLFLLLKWWMRQRHGQAELATVEAKTPELGQQEPIEVLPSPQRQPSENYSRPDV